MQYLQHARFVVTDTAPIEEAIALLGLKGRRLPQSQRIRWLYVCVCLHQSQVLAHDKRGREGCACSLQAHIEQNGGRVLCVQPLRVH